MGNVGRFRQLTELGSIRQAEVNLSAFEHPTHPLSDGSGQCPGVVYSYTMKIFSEKKNIFLVPADQA